jgi:hypothetical protein
MGDSFGFREVNMLARRMTEDAEDEMRCVMLLELCGASVLSVWGADVVRHAALRGLVTLLPLDVYPDVGLVVSSTIKSLGRARWCHKPYFDAKKMMPHECALFIVGRKPSYHGASSIHPHHA